MGIRGDEAGIRLGRLRAVDIGQCVGRVAGDAVDQLLIFVGIEPLTALIDAADVESGDLLAERRDEIALGVD